MVARCIGYLFEWDNGCESSNRHQPFVVTCSAQVITHSLLARAGDNPVRVARWVAGFIGGVDVEAKNVQCKIRWDMVVIGLVVEVIFQLYRCNMAFCGRFPPLNILPFCQHLALSLHESIQKWHVHSNVLLIDRRRTMAVVQQQRRNAEKHNTGIRARNGSDIVSRKCTFRRSFH